MWDAYTLDKERDPFGGVRREQEAHRVTSAKLDAALAEIRRLRADAGTNAPVSADDQGGRVLARANAEAQRLLIQGLVRARLAAGLTREDVAELLGRTPEQIAAFEAREDSPTLARVANYAQAVGAYLHYSTTPTRKEQP